jgi:hypothetical protein
MEQMIIINFYKKHNTNWDELQTQALETIARFEKESNENVLGELSTKQQYDDYKSACKQGMKTFIMMVLNEWEHSDLLVLNDEFYKKFEFIEIDGILQRYHFPNLYRTTKELFGVFNKEKIKLTTESFDQIYETFTDSVICNVNSFEFEIKEIDEDNDFLSGTGFNDLLE